MEIVLKNRDKVIAIILPLVIFFGNPSFLDIKIGGLTLTLYRVLIPLGVVSLLFFCIRDKDLTAIKPRREETITYGIVAIWLFYGIFTLAFFPYSDFHDGALELLALLLGVMVAFCTIILCKKNVWDYLLVGIKIVVIMTIIIALYEIITANHLSTSRFCDPEFIKTNRELFGEEAELFKWHIATSIFYNENDYSAMLAIFAAFFAIGSETQGRGMKTINLIVLCLIFTILHFNNAFICFIAFLIGLAIVLLFGLRGVISRILLISSLVVTRIVVYVIEKLLDLKLGLGSTLIDQIDNNANGIGSMYLRLNTYKVTIHETFMTSKGMGFGAGSFSKYFSQFVDSHMIMSNPHCFWFEILSEYGVVIFVLFASLLVLIMTRLIRKYYKTRNRKCILVIAAGASLIIASVAPSSFLKYGYYWILIGMAVFLADDDYNDTSDFIIPKP